MLNPDGVANGSHRCSLVGADLNRRWDAPDPQLHRTIYHSKLLLRWLCHLGRTPLAYVDLHGHSLHKNMFLYGCRLPGAAPGVEDELVQVLDRHAALFDAAGCKFAVEASRMSTSRVVVWQMGVARSYTLEMTYCGANRGPYAGTQVTAAMLEEAGVDVVLGIGCATQHESREGKKEKEKGVQMVGAEHETAVVDAAPVDLVEATPGVAVGEVKPQPLVIVSPPPGTVGGTTAVGGGGGGISYRDAMTRRREE